jgi:hypothetical protein
MSACLLERPTKLRLPASPLLRNVSKPALKIVIYVRFVCPNDPYARMLGPALLETSLLPLQREEIGG